jgi:hypothetical protein
MKPNSIKPKKMKIPAIKIPCDECAISVGQVVVDGEITDPGTPYYVHEGESVEMMPVITVREVMQLSKLQQAATETGSLGESLSELCEELSHRIVSWDWTDLAGEPLEQPYQKPEVLKGLSSDELLWLVNAASGQETAEDRKKE